VGARYESMGITSSQARRLPRRLGIKHYVHNGALS
jgi:hypothetical protein